MNDTKKLMSVLILLSILIASIFYLMHYRDGTEKKKEAISDVQGWNLRDSGTEQWGYMCPLTSANTTKKCRVWGEANCNTITSTAIRYSLFSDDADVPKNPDGSLNGCSQYECTNQCSLTTPLVQVCGGTYTYNNICNYPSYIPNPSNPCVVNPNTGEIYYEVIAPTIGGGLTNRKCCCNYPNQYKFQCVANQYSCTEHLKFASNNVFMSTANYGPADHSGNYYTDRGTLFTNCNTLPCPLNTCNGLICPFNSNSASNDVELKPGEGVSFNGRVHYEVWEKLDYVGSCRLTPTIEKQCVNSSYYKTCQQQGSQTGWSQPIFVGQGKYCDGGIITTCQTDCSYNGQKECVNNKKMVCEDSTGTGCFKLKLAEDCPSLGKICKTSTKECASECINSPCVYNSDNSLNEKKCKYNTGSDEEYYPCVSDAMGCGKWSPSFSLCEGVCVVDVPSTLKGHCGCPSDSCDPNTYGSPRCNGDLIISCDPNANANGCNDIIELYNCVESLGSEYSCYNGECIIPFDVLISPVKPVFTKSEDIKAAISINGNNNFKFKGVVWISPNDDGSNPLSTYKYIDNGNGNEVAPPVTKGKEWGNFGKRDMGKYYIFVRLDYGNLKKVFFKQEVNVELDFITEVSIVNGDAYTQTPFKLDVESFEASNIENRVSATHVIKSATVGTTNIQTISSEEGELGEKLFVLQASKEGKLRVVIESTNSMGIKITKIFEGDIKAASVQIDILKMQEFLLGFPKGLTPNKLYTFVFTTKDMDGDPIDANNEIYYGSDKDIKNARVITGGKSTGIRGKYTFSAQFATEEFLIIKSSYPNIATSVKSIPIGLSRGTYCGDGTCDYGETKSGCPDDCDLGRDPLPWVWIIGMGIIVIGGMVFLIWKTRKR